MKKLFAFGAVMIVLAAQIYAQGTGEIKGRLFDSDSKLSLPGAHVIVKNGNTNIAVESDINGYYKIKPLSSGKYTVIFSYVGYKSDTITGVTVDPGKITAMDDISMGMEGIWLNGKIAEKIEYRDPIIRPDPINIIRDGDLEVMAGKTKLENIISKMTSEVYVNERDEIYFRGARNDNFIYIVDGVKSPDGQAHIPSGAIGSMAIYTGGVPAQYGDFTGGCIVIETKSFFSR
ncbi:MAG: carboxypeptidase-like regulatory domain-containing protein [Bacteroidota bacterium]